MFTVYRDIKTACDPCSQNIYVDFTMSIRDNLRTQLEEMEMLKSIFAQPGEFREDRDSLSAVSAYVHEGYEFSVPPLVYSINLAIDDVCLEVNITLQASYPSEKPSLYLRDRSVTGTLDITGLNAKLKDYMKDLEKGETCIWQSIMWLQENASPFYKATKTLRQTTKKQTLSRYWVYSHHIYSKNKRKNILDLALRCELTGFILPGKPGIMCLEGYDEVCHAVWLEIKHMNWQKIVIKKEEKECAPPRKFSSFTEQCFEGHSDRHMDMGKFLIFLKEHDCEHIFKEYFGCNGQIADDS